MKLLFYNSRQSLAVAGLSIVFAALIVASCRHELPAPVADSGYPAAVAKIMVNKCATSGCHNTTSGAYAAGLELDTWDHLFNGSNGGATVIPYDNYLSTLLHYVNTDSTLGHISTPRMPANGQPLSREEYLTLQNWILAGAPDKDGNIPFGSNAATRQKIYMTQQGCDQLAVVDAGRGVIMRYLTVGNNAEIESPHCVRVSEDGRYAYISFLNGNDIQKIDCATDKMAGSVQVSSGSAQWNILNVSKDGSQLLAADFINGVLKMVRTSDMTVTRQYSATGVIVNPHGIAANAAFDTFYVTLQNGNCIFKFSLDGGLQKKISLNGQPITYNPGGPDPHEIMLTPDGSKYFVTCQSTDEVKVMDAHSDAVLATLSAGHKPQEIAMSRALPYVFVTCQEDPRTEDRVKGSVYVYNYNTLQLVKVIQGPFFQPHALTVDDRNAQLYVVSTNADPSGPAPHHVGLCGGRNGWYSIYDLNTLELATGRRFETSVFPYSADSRFK